MTAPVRLSNLRLVTAVFMLGLACSCGGSSNPVAPMPRARVEFVYRAATATDAAVRAAFPNCVAAVGVTHIHPGWRDFVRINLTAIGDDRWEITFTDVPVDSEQRIRISDPNTCNSDPNGASTENVFANGVRLTRIVDTPGNGTEPGLAFSVTADGTVTP